MNEFQAAAGPMGELRAYLEGWRRLCWVCRFDRLFRWMWRVVPWFSLGFVTALWLIARAVSA